MTNGESKILPPKPPAPVPKKTGNMVENLQESESMNMEEYAPMRVPLRKSPLAAALLAFFPFGLGHLYLGQYARAICFFVAFWVPMLVLQVPLLAMFFYFFTIFDAFRQAQLMNLRMEDSMPTETSVYQGGLAAGVFLLVLGTYLLVRQWINLDFIQEFLQQWWPGVLVIIGLWMIIGAIREQKSQENDEDIYRPS